MKIEIYVDADSVALAAAKLIAKEARDAVATRGKFVMAVSGGKTPWVMLRDLAKEDVPWKGVHVFQVDERVAPEGDPDRNLTHLRESLLEHAPLRPDQIHAMPVEAGNLESARRQCRTYGNVSGTSPHDADVSRHQSLPLRAVAGNRSRKGGNAYPAASGGCFHSSRPHTRGSCHGFGRSCCRRPSC